MNAYRCIDVWESLCNRQYLGERLEIHAHAQGMSYARRLHSGHHALEIAGELGKIDMAMRVDQHGPAAT